ncbi:hypothetical protein CFC21_018557 [Triticum aestivum]|uniref:DUF295 domain-containing protein n=2 Tax=Triticum aestivum TaxID=4565 RepID=A0A9R1E487_WHEAT|nr:hypothetical protein CFC21_018555 [Triticum aestivum]KAF7003194.1 hypothetical protein CFC21_018557 [Triticum aestivum]
MSTTTGSTQSSSSPQWSDLPDDLLGLVRLRLACPRDRVRVAAVCKGWRAAASLLPRPPGRPLLLVSLRRVRCNGTKRLCGPDDSWVVRVPDKAEDKWFLGSHEGGWVAAVDWSKLVIVNLFSGEEVEASPSPDVDDIGTTSLQKIIFSEAPTSSSCILAAIAYERSHIALCKSGRHESGWTVKTLGEKFIIDIAFCKGELYGLVYPNEELIRFKIDMKAEGTPVITSCHPLAIERRHGTQVYEAHLLELHGKPTMAIDRWWLPNRESFFKIFTLVDTDNDKAYKYKWVEVLNFGDHALFLGVNWSKAVHVTADGHHGLKRNHVYYSEENLSPTKKLPDDVVYLVTIDNDGQMYCREDQSVGDGVERTGYYVTSHKHRPMWVCPTLL